MDTELKCACGAPATSGSSRNECGACYRARLLSVRLDTSVTPTRSVRNYFDTVALDDAFGDDRVDRYWDETEGMGALHRGPDGNLWHEPKGAEGPQIASPEVIESFLGPESEDVL